jgi:hypothetical protein
MTDLAARTVDIAMRRTVYSLVAAAAVAAGLSAPVAAAEPSTFDDTGGVLNVNGIPCYAHLGTCLSFIQNRPPKASPGARSTVGHSPTIVR